MTHGEPRAATDGDARALRRGVRMSALGTAAKLLHPVHLVVATRLFGPTAVGIYLLTTTILEVVVSLSISGLKDAVVLFGARRPDVTGARSGLTPLERATATATRVALLCALATIVGVAVFGGDIVGAWLGSESAETAAAVVDALQLAVWALPCIAITEIAVAATRARMVMHVDALVLGFGKPAVAIVTAATFYVFSGSARTLVIAYVVTQALLAVVSVAIVARDVSLRRTAAAVWAGEPDRALVRFAVPQSLTLTLGSLLAGVDVLMLAYFGVAPATIAFYKVGAMLVRNVRQIKVALSAPFAPLVARWLGEGRPDLVERRLADLARVATSLAVPVLALVLVWRAELLGLFSPDFADDTSFMAWLVVPCLVSCSVGIGGSVIAMAGRPRWNLVDAVVTGVVNVVLNACWIPSFGLVGAAAGAAVASLVGGALVVVQLRVGLKVRVGARAFAGPVLASLAGLAVGTLVTGLGEGAGTRVAATVLGLGAYLAGLRMLRRGSGRVGLPAGLDTD